MRKSHLIDGVIRPITGVPPICPLTEAAALMAREHLAAVLVVENDRSVGLVTERAVVGAVGERRSPDTPVATLMRPLAPAITAGATPAEAAALMESVDVDWLAVMDETGRCIGLLTAPDLLRALAAFEPALSQREADEHQRLMLEALRAREARYQSILAALGGGIVAQDASGRITAVNPAAERILGLTANQLRGRTSTDPGWRAIRADGSPFSGDTHPAMVALATGESQRDAIMGIQKSDGALIWISANAEPLRRKNETRPYAVATSFFDITERRAIEQRLAEERILLRGLYNAIPDLVWLKDPQGVYMLCNPAFTVYFGAPKDAIIGKTDFDFVDRATAEFYRQKDLEAIGADEARRNEEWLTYPDGARRLVETTKTPVFRPDGSLLGVLGIAHDITERHEIETELRRLSQAVEQSPVSIVITDLTGKIEYVNPYFTEITGYSREEALGQNPRVLKSDATAPEHYRRLWATITAGGTWTGEFHNRRKDGAPYWERAVIAPIRDADGRIVQYLAVKQNITEQKRLEDELRQRERYQRAVLDNFPFLIWLKDIESRFLAVNQPFADACGLPDSEALAGKTDLDIWPRDLAENYRADDRAVLESRRKKVIEEQVVDRGERRWFETYKAPVVASDGVLLGTVGFARDITDRKQVEDQLRQSEARYRQVVNSVKEVIFQTDLEGRWRFLNPAWEEITGFPVADSLGQTFLDYVHPDDRQRDQELFAPLIARQKDHCRHEVRYLRADGGFRWIEVFARLTLGADDEILGTAGTLTDITARKVAEAATQRALAETRRLAQVRSDFLANMSHEIRTPLNVILGLTQAAHRQPCDPVTRRYFAQIEDAGQRLLAVVNDILDFSKIEAGKLNLEQAPFHLGRMIDQVLMLVAPQAYGKGLVLELDEAVDLPAVWLGDGFRLSQVLLNLLSNAVKFTEQGRVALSVHRARDPGESAGILFRIEDSGIGMTTEQLERLFQPFQQADSSTTRQFGGTGLGLVICKRMVDLMAGDIRVDSQPGQGSTFEVRLPLRPTEEATKIAAASWRSVALSGLTAAETRALSETLPEWGVEARELPVAVIGAAAGCDLILLESAALVENSVVAAIGAALDRHQHCFVASTPGTDFALPAVLRGRVSLIERPLNARRLLAMEPLPDEPAPPLAKGQRLAGLRILAVEDNRVNQMVLTELLTQEGARITLADHGVQALARLAEQGSAVFDLVLTDIQMPEMDGYETTRRIRALAPGLPVIGLTAHAMPEERDRCLAAGMLDHVAKPFNLDVLVAAIRRHTAATGSISPPAVRIEPSFTPLRPEQPVIAMTTPAPIADPIIDWVALNDYFEGNGELIDQLVELTLQTQSETATQLRAVADGPDWERMIHLAHSLKSVCGYLQSQRALDLAKRTEQGARQQHAEAPQLARELAAALDELMAALAAHRGATATPAPEAITDNEFAAHLHEFADALQSRRMDACRLAEFLRDRLPDDSRRPALEAAIREALRLEFAAALAHIEPLLPSTGTGGG